MYQRANGLIGGKLIITSDCLLGLKHVHRDPALVQQVQRFGAAAKPFVHPLRQHNHRSPVIKQFYDITRLDSRCVPCTCFAPIPLPRSTRIQFGILERRIEVVHVDAPPFKMYNSR